MQYRILGKRGYSYGKEESLADDMVKQLNDNASTAIERAKGLKEYGNPSTTVYLLVKELERLKKEEEEKTKKQKGTA